MWSVMPSDMLSFGAGFLWYDHGNGQYPVEELARYQDDSDSQAAHAINIIDIIIYYTCLPTTIPTFTD